MKKIETMEELRQAIRDLEHQNYVNEQHMRLRFSQIMDRLKPANLVRSLFSQLLGGPGLGTNLVRMVVGLTASLIAKKFFRKGIAAKP